ncbi:MAG: endopeptidase La [Thermoflexales bacterium]|nr:endopeptidase La [Thermoflexales bacterium]
MSDNDQERLNNLLQAAVEAAATQVAESGEPITEGADKPAPLPSTLYILPLRGVLVYPSSALPLRVAQPRAIKLIDDALIAKASIGLVASKTPGKEDPGPEDIYDVGTAATIVRNFRAPDGIVNMIVQGHERFRIVEITQSEPYIIARVEPLPEAPESTLEIEALRRNLSQGFARMAELAPSVPEELAQMIQNITDPRQLTYAVATYMRMDMADAQRLLEMNGLPDKMLFLLQLLNKELEVLELGKKIQTEATSEMEKLQRDYYLREQMKAIQRELGEADEQQIEVADFRKKIAECGMNAEARREAEREVERMAKLPTQAAEYGVIRTYLDWLTTLPWAKNTPDNLDMAHARAVLDEDHYGLKDIKERILEFLAVRKRKLELAAEPVQEEARPSGITRPVREGVILCFVGPPGVGKTSLGASIARAMGRKFIRSSVGGVRDEAEIRGFRRTYIGSMPGRVVQSLRRAESNNPVFMLDEIDKMGSDFRGDPSSALLEVLDPEQNREFRDHYLDVPFDLSQVIFICTANSLESIPGPLRDRMEILQLSGYTELEKLSIARGYLVPRQIKENGLKTGEVTFADEAIVQLMRDFTREAGVRNLEREIGSISRKLLTRALEGKGRLPVKVTAKMLPELLGKPKFYFEAIERTATPGVATGMVWTPVGGDIVFIEATRMKGSKGFILTGQLGDVMRESAQAALSFLRTHASELDIKDEVFEKYDIHVHVPAGAQPKDGPSAGVTMATALASLLTERRVRSDVAMTGEITLRGLVLPVGGVRDKILAAHRVGMKTIILPRRNEADLDELPDDVRKTLDFVLVDRIEQVWKAALLPVRKKK